MYCKSYLNLHLIWLVFKDHSTTVSQLTTMKKSLIRGTILLGMISSTFAADLDMARIDQITGLKGKFNQKEGVYKITFPRDDVKVVVDGWTMPPFMGLGTWAAFTSTKDGAMVMGDTVLFEDEVNAAMSAALDNGLNVTALHNHFFFDHPKVYFMHIEGEGAVDKLAGAVKKVYDATKQVRAANSQPKDSAHCPCRKRVPSMLRLLKKSSEARVNQKTECLSSRSVGPQKCTVQTSARTWA
jgi:uncharacterized protein DUF1259